MIIQTPRSRLHAAVDTLLTALAWIGFIYLLGAGLWEMFQGGREQGPDIPVVSVLLPSLGTLGIYLVVALFNAGILLVWARYNAIRYGGLDRRQAPLPLTDAQLAQSFGVHLLLRMRLAGAKAMTVHHTAEGHIHSIDFHIEEAIALAS